MSDLPVLVLAAGASSRFFPLNSGHKSFATVWGRSLLGHCLVSLAEAGFTNIGIVVSPSAPTQDHEFFGVPAELHRQLRWVVQPEPQGMADAINRGWQALGQPERVGVVSGYQLGAGPAIGQLSQLGTQSVVSLHPTSYPENYGIVKLDRDQVVEVIEKPPHGTEPSNLKIQSVYVLGREILSQLDQVSNHEFGLEEILNKVAQIEPLAAYHNPHELPSLKYAWHLFSFFDALAHQTTTFISPDAKVATTAVLDDQSGPIVIQAGAVVGHAAKIVGPCYIGRDALVGDFSFVRGSSVEARAKVGANTEVVRSIIMSDSSIHFGYLADSIVGRKVKIAAGLITANRRLDRGPIKTKIKDQLVSTDLTSFGCCLGDNVQLGIRTNLMPGVCVGAGTVVYPGQTLYHNVPSNQVIKP